MTGGTNTVQVAHYGILIEEAVRKTRFKSL